MGIKSLRSLVADALTRKDPKDPKHTKGTRPTHGSAEPLVPGQSLDGKDNTDVHSTRVDYRSIEQQAEEKAAAFQHAKGKKTARERLELLLDDDSFVEIGRFRGGHASEGFLGASVITGFGEINGRPVAVYAQDFSLKGGTLGSTEGAKICELMDKAIAQRIPIVSMLDSGGARIQEGVMALAQYGRIFRRSCKASGLIPQISIILGPCAGGAVYSPALTDFVVMTRENSHMFVTGPDVVRAVTGEDVTPAELGGAELHNVQSGVAHYLGEDEEDAIDYARSLLNYLPSHCDELPPHYAYTTSTTDETAAAGVGEMVPSDSRQPYNMVEVVEALVDHGEFVQVQEYFAPSIVIGFACINGGTVGIVADQPNHNAGTLDVDASEKAARFVRCCDAFGIPVVTLVDVPGYRPGTDQEQAGIIRRGAKLIFAYANATVPLVTVTLRKAYGGAYIVMGSKSIGADFSYAWPDAELAVMGADGAVNILHRREIKAAGPDKKAMAAKAKELADEYAAENINPNLSVASGELDGIIEPSQTRQVIAEALEVLKTKDRTHPGPKRHNNGPL
ncbi:acyl-CoA carboxylase subunit beta [Corynebacterium falsenii]|uniref:acyl-CoA carboxylase subunit beta n=1 Tax=Corynebacterium falsenii TaxID=108486 RepID=UPI00234C1039|nr:acyl-CoA carboxylase subunit beta [Corynebacterium falsenii]MDC7104819.1 acyl-CoA carboxylase subunit beta [Corynebacterium falsenii]